jgi:hypothetical protein
MKMMENKVIIGEGTAYDDVTVAVARFIVEGRQKQLKVCWLSHMNIKILGRNALPRGVFPLRYGASGLYPIAMRLTLSRRFAMPLVPLATKRWVDFGCGLFLMDDNDQAIGRKEYMDLTMTLQEYGVQTAEIQPDTLRRECNWLVHPKEYSTDDWDIV